MEKVSKIIDWRGQPIKTHQLAEDQTSRIGPLGTEYANHPSRGLTPGKLASILAEGEQGRLSDQADLGEDMEEKDAHIFAELSKRKRALLGLQWELAPPRDASPAEERAADEITDILQNMPDFEDLLFDIADGIGYGFSQCELSWARAGRYHLPTATHRPPRWFTTADDDRNALLLRTADGKGEPLWPFGWISHIHKAKSGYITRAGLHRVLAWPFLFKNYSVRDLAEFLEIYGLPVRLGTYPGGATEAEKTTLLRAVVGIGHNAAGIIPEGMAVEFKEAAKGQSDPFQAMIAWCEASQSKAILGGTLTTSAENTGLGSNLGDVHNEVRHDLLVSDARQIGGTLSRDLVWPLLALNIAGIAPERAPRFKFLTAEAEDLQARAERDRILFDMGYRLSAEHVETVYGEGYELISTATPGPLATDAGRGRQTTTPPPLAGEAGRGSQTAAAKTEPPPAPDYADIAAETLGRSAEPYIKEWIARLRDLLEQADSLEEAQALIEAAYDDLPPDAMARTLGEALAAAHLAGRDDGGAA